MTGKTHMTSSLLCSSYLLRINPINFIYIPFLILGSLILDVDTKYSKIQQITYIIFYIFMGGFIIYKNENFITIIAILLIIIMSIIAKKYTKHRTFTHSLLGLFLYGSCVFLISKIGALYFAIGYISHMLLDSLSEKGIMLLYPLDKVFKIGDFKIDKTTDYTINLVTILLTFYLVFI